MKNGAVSLIVGGTVAVVGLAALCTGVSGFFSLPAVLAFLVVAYLCNAIK